MREKERILTKSYTTIKKDNVIKTYYQENQLYGGKMLYSITIVMAVKDEKVIYEFKNKDNAFLFSNLLTEELENEDKKFLNTTKLYNDFVIDFNNSIKEENTEDIVYYDSK
jgi:hypothetical protein